MNQNYPYSCFGELSYGNYDYFIARLNSVLSDALTFDYLL